jgi:23S rRNA (cytidine1920-2'-O)/16S rRNA (cytidine1409-2'-O)-methyltransferase
LPEEKIRLDELILHKGLATEINVSRGLILSGNILVNDEVQTKIGFKFHPSVEIRIKTSYIDFAGRGANKLQPILNQFNIDINNKVCLDLGASTGGFTDVLLKKNASRVYAIDIGYGLLDGSLRNNKRVIPIEKFHIKHLKWTTIDSKENYFFIVIDLSFISLTSILHVLKNMKKEKPEKNLEILCLIKPQFELNPKFLQKGIVRSSYLRWFACLKIAKFVKQNCEGTLLNLKESPITGKKGNIEVFLHWKL